MRPAQAVSCSMAAARNVSAAARRTFAPRDLKRQASFAIVVVLPVPLTPTTRMTAGCPWPGLRGHEIDARDANSSSSSCWSATSGGRSRRARVRSTTSIASSAPMSAPMIASSTCSHASTSGDPDPSRLRTRAPKPRRVGSSESRSVPVRRAAGSVTRCGWGSRGWRAAHAPTGTATASRAGRSARRSEMTRLTASSPTVTP